MFNQGFRYVSSCVSCERLASTADIGWEVYLLYLRNIIICVFVGYLKYFVKSCISSRDNRFFLVCLLKIDMTVRTKLNGLDRIAGTVSVSCLIKASDMSFLALAVNG